MRVAYLLFFLTVQPALAADAILSWSPNLEIFEPVCPNVNETNDFSGYRVWWGTASRNYSNSFAVGNVTEHTVTGLGQGIFYFAATAYDACGNESGFSNEVFKSIEPEPVPHFLVVDKSIKPNGRCRFTLSADPPDSIAGWLAQFYSGTSPLGKVDASFPYIKFVDTFAGAYSFAVVFQNSGQSIAYPSVAATCP